MNSEKLPNYEIAKQQGTVTHEMGHAFGLHHYNTNAYSIMCQSYASNTGIRRVVETVQQEDNDAINAKYGN